MLAKPDVEPDALFSASMIGRAIRDAFAKLDPRTLIANPVIFVTEVVAALVTVLSVEDLVRGRAASFAIAIAFFLWLTVLFATFAEAVA